MLRLSRSLCCYRKFQMHHAFDGVGYMLSGHQTRIKKPRILHTVHYTKDSVASNTQLYFKNLANGADIFLIGTTHISKKSVEEVKEAIKWVKPDIVFVELCKERADKIRNNSSDSSIFEDFLKIFQGALKSPNTLGGAFTEAVFKGFYRFVKSLGLEPGLEFKTAIEEAEKINAVLVLGDRPVKETMSRISQNMSMFDILKMMMPMQKSMAPNKSVENAFKQMGNLEASVEALKNRAMVREMLGALEQINPNFAKVLVYERDEYMVDILLQLRGKVVAVVGLGHLDGIERRWMEKQSILNKDNSDVIEFTK